MPLPFRKPSRHLHRSYADAWRRVCPVPPISIPGMHGSQCSRHSKYIAVISVTVAIAVAVVLPFMALVTVTVSGAASLTIFREAPPCSA
jgi:hypothetical protein